MELLRSYITGNTRTAPQRCVTRAKSRRLGPSTELLAGATLANHDAALDNMSSCATCHNKSRDADTGDNMRIRAERALSLSKEKMTRRPASLADDLLGEPAAPVVRDVDEMWKPKVFAAAQLYMMPPHDVTLSSPASKAPSVNTRERGLS